jgi:DNA-binding NarL/FixJ family response regulator
MLLSDEAGWSQHHMGEQAFRIPVSRGANGRIVGHSGTMHFRCLIVDDNAAFLEAAGALLRREGVDVVGVAENSAEALRLVRALRPDVTLVDIALGDENGFDLAEQISSNGPAQHVILISTHAEQDFAQLIEAGPALGFVSKARLSAKAIADILDRADAA